MTVDIEGQEVKVDGPEGSLSMTVNALVGLKVEEGLVVFVPNGNDRKSEAMAGTTRASCRIWCLAYPKVLKSASSSKALGIELRRKVIKCHCSWAFHTQ